MPQRSFYFLRHGETDWNKEKRLQGHTDIPLNETGRAQAKAVIPLLHKLPINRIVSSTLSRAFETACIINEHWNKPLETDARLIERNFGILQGKTEEEANILKAGITESGEHPIEPSGYPCPPGAETYSDFHNRAIACLREHLAKDPNENILFVCHGGIYRILHRHLFDKAGQSPNAHPYLFDLQNGQWDLRSA